MGGFSGDTAAVTALRGIPSKFGAFSTVLKWEETQHPRDDAGKFTEKAGAAATAQLVESFPITTDPWSTHFVLGSGDKLRLDRHGDTHESAAQLVNMSVGELLKTTGLIRSPHDDETYEVAQVPTEGQARTMVEDFRHRMDSTLRVTVRGTAENPVLASQSFDHPTVEGIQTFVRQTLEADADPTFPRGRTFTSDEGYQWHEQGPVAEWAKELAYPDTRALEDYAGFGYGDTNAQLRGTFTPSIINEYVRPATREEMIRVGWDPDKHDWVPAIKVRENPPEYQSGHPVDPRDQVTPESIAKFGHPFSKRGPSDFDPADPYHQVADGRIVVDAGYRNPAGQTEMFSIQRAVVDLKRVDELNAKADRLNDLIAHRGYVLPEAITVERGAYLPGVSFEDLQAMAHPGPKGELPAIFEEKGFTSTMVGDAEGRANSYPYLGKFESLHKRFGKIQGHEDEVGSAIRFHIILPKGTKVAPIEPVRRLDYTFPNIPNPEPIPADLAKDPWWQQHPEAWTIRDYSAKPTVSDKDLSSKQTRSESEVLLGSGARFRVVKVTHGETRRSGDDSLKPVRIEDVTLEYIGGGSSDGRVQKWEEAEHPRDKTGKFTGKSQQPSSLAANDSGKEGEAEYIDDQGVKHVGDFVELYHGTSRQRAEKIRREGFKIRAVRKQTMGGDPESSRNYIWFAKRLDAAQRYSQMHGDPAVVTVRIPADVLKQIDPHGHNSGPDSVWIPQTIPAKYIHTIAKPKLAIDCHGVLKWEEHQHPRDKKGKFTKETPSSIHRIVKIFAKGVDADGDPIVGPTDDYNSTKFILPDGTRLAHGSDQHYTAAKALGVDLYEAIKAGIIRFTPGTGAEIGAPITQVQAQHLVDAYHYQTAPLHVDVFAGKQRDYKQFDERATADTVRNWVNGHFSTQALKWEEAQHPRDKEGQFTVKRMWHLTADPHFTPDPHFKPFLNRIFISDLMRDPKDQPAGLFVTDKPEYWMQAHGYERPYVAEIEGPVTNPPGSVRVGHEDFMQAPMKTVRVLPIDEYAKEKFGEQGWVSEWHAPPRRFGDPIPRFRNYQGRPVSEMSPAEIKAWEEKFAAWARRPDGPNPPEHVEKKAAIDCHGWVLKWEEFQHPRVQEGSHAGEFTGKQSEGQDVASDPALVTQKTAGIAAVERLLPEAVKTADYQGPGSEMQVESWADVAPTTKEQVWHVFRAQGLAANAVDPKGIADPAKALEVIGRTWDHLSDTAKFNLMNDFAIDRTIGVREVVAKEPDHWVTGIKEGERLAYEGILNDDYARTHVIALRLTELRTDELRRERGLTTQPRSFSIREQLVTPATWNRLHAAGEIGEWSGTQPPTAIYSVLDSSGVLVEGPQHVIFNTREEAEAWGKEWSTTHKPSSADLIGQIWHEWKQSSSGPLSNALQLAAAREFGGHHRLTEEEVSNALGTADGYGGIDTLRAYVRAQWEVTQTIMAKSGYDHVEVYRGLMLPGNQVGQTKHQLVDEAGHAFHPSHVTVTPPGPTFGGNTVAFDVGSDHLVAAIREGETPEQAMYRRLDTWNWQIESPKTFTQLPELRLQRAGAQSTTSTKAVANSWNGVGHLPEDPTRVVLRIAAPTTSVLSLPVYGQNEQEEHELVLMGTKDHWYWDAWRNAAPDFVTHPGVLVQKAETTPLVIDLQALDRGQPHWLSQTNFAALARRANQVLKWEESQHPRVHEGSHAGEFTAAGTGGVTGDVAPDPVLAKQAESGVAAVEKLIPEAIKTADFQATPRAYDSWHDVDPDLRNEVYDQYRNQQWEEGIEVDTSSIDDEFKRDLQKDNKEVITDAKKATFAALEHAFPDSDPTLPLADQPFELRRRVDPDTLQLMEDTGDPKLATHDSDDTPLLNVKALRFTNGDRLSQADRDQVVQEWKGKYEAVFGQHLQEIYESDAYSEARNDLENATIDEAWEGMSDEAKLDLLTEYGLGPKASRGQKLAAKAPDHWMTGVEESETFTAEDYSRTHAIANRLTELRTDELLKERGVDEPKKRPYTIEDRSVPGHPNFVIFGSGGTSVGASNTLEQAQLNAEQYAKGEYESGGVVVRSGAPTTHDLI
ncbi:MAG: hypothetical protein C5B54_05065, partial [Acidobacteria bacterium]